MKKQNLAALLPYPCNRWARGAKIKFRLSMALLVAGVFSLSRPRESWPRITGALKTWIRFARQDRPTPRWIYFSRLRTCYRCPLFYKPLRTCGSPLVKDLRDVGCMCDMEIKAAAIEATCWYRETTYDDTEFGWPASLTRYRNPADSGTDSIRRKPCFICGRSAGERSKVSGS